MIKYTYLSRRNFFNYLRLSFVFLVASCAKGSKKIVIGFQKTFFPESFKKILPKLWDKENIDFIEIYNPKNIYKYNKLDYLLVNDGWLNKLKFDDFKDFDEDLFSKLNEKSMNFLNTFEKNIRNKLLPLGVIPYGVIIKNNSDIKNIASESWDFLLHEDLKGKIILPNSPRILLSLAETIDDQKAFNKLIDQQNIYDDENAMDWLLNSKAVVAVMPFFLCQKILNFDSRLSLVFPRKGVPLMWQFIMCKSYSNQSSLLEWIDSLDNYNVQKKVFKEGWYPTFKYEYMKDLYNSKDNIKNSGPSYECLQNSWSLSLLSEKEKNKIEVLWETLLSP